MLKKIAVLSLICISLSIGSVFANVTDNLKFNGYIADEANILDEQIEYDLNRTIHDLYKKTKSAIAVVILKSLNNENIDQVNENISKTYQIGDSEVQKNAILLVSIDDHQLQLLLDKGLIGEIKPKQLKNIVDGSILPFFQKSEYADGVISGTNRLADDIAKKNKQTIQHFGNIPIPEKSFNKNWLWLLAIPLVGIVVGLFLALNKKDINDNKN